jgi:hypothetical protein
MEQERQGRPGVAERHARLAAAVEAMEGLAGVLPLVQGVDLPGLMETSDRLAVLTAAGRVAVTAEASGRGEISASQSSGVHGWVRDHAPSLREDGSAAVVRCVEAFTKPDTADAREAVLSGRVGPAVGWSVVRNMDRLRGRLVPEAVPTVTEAMLGAGGDWGPAMVGRLRHRLLAEYGQEGKLEEAAQRSARLVSLSHGRVDDDGMVTYRLLADAELTAVLEAALGPHVAPTPAPDWSPDPRPPERRGAEALAAVCRRSIGAAGAAPVLLGSRGEILDVRHLVRCFTPGQPRLLRLRDRHCTFPGCTVPGSWSDGHHVRFWANGGVTEVENGALLCGRHHHVVHRDRLVATVNGRGGGAEGLATPAVQWDLRPGSYDRALERWRLDDAREDARAASGLMAGEPPPAAAAGLGAGPSLGPRVVLPPGRPDGVLEIPLDAAPWDDPEWEPEDPGPDDGAWQYPDAWLEALSA